MVLHITTGLNDGGAEAVLYRLICNDAPSHHHVISLIDEGKYGPLLIQAGAKVTCLNMPRGRLTVGGLWRLVATMGAQSRRLAEERFDVHKVNQKIMAVLGFGAAGRSDASQETPAN